MTRHTIPFLCTLALMVAACGPQSGGPGASDEAAALQLSGMWEVEGTTVEKGSEQNARKIKGTVILSQEGNQYTSTFTMETMIPTPDGASLSTDVIGKGEGTIEGSSIGGTARTQLVIATVPGVDPDFAFIPRSVTTRIVSKVSGTAAPDGTFVMEIENAPEPGEDYVPTRTTLRGKRVGPVDVAGSPEQ
jgi:hypothetical protein